MKIDPYIYIYVYIHIRIMYSLYLSLFISIATSFPCPIYMLKWVDFLLVVLHCVNVCGFRPQHANGFSWKYISAPLRLMSVVTEVPGEDT